MDRKYIDDHHIVARYLADQLSDTEREAFEAWYLDHPDVVQELEATARFKVGLMQLRQSGELSELLNPAPRRWRPYLAAAASTAIVAFGALFFVERISLPQSVMMASAAAFTDHGHALPIADVKALLRTRGNPENSPIDRPQTGQLIELRVTPEVESETAQYQASLLRVGADSSLQEVAAVHKLVPTTEGFVSVYLNAAKLDPGRYQLILAADSGAGTASESTVFTLQLR